MKLKKSASSRQSSARKLQHQKGAYAADLETGSRGGEEDMHPSMKLFQILASNEGGREMEDSVHDDTGHVQAAPEVTVKRSSDNRKRPFIPRLRLKQDPNVGLSNTIGYTGKNRTREAIVEK